jgi:hypothetical protein
MTGTIMLAKQRVASSNLVSRSNPPHPLWSPERVDILGIKPYIERLTA